MGREKALYGTKLYPVHQWGGLLGFSGMGRGARSTVRWKHDRIRRKKQREARVRAAKAEARKPAAAS